MKITEALAAEHTTLLALFDQIERVLPSLATHAEIQMLADIIENLLKAHAEREANLAYLALDHVLAEQGDLQRMHQEHREIDNRLRLVESARTCAESRRLLRDALGASREHFRLEEQCVFPLMENLLGEEALAELGLAWVERRELTTGARAA